jgi:hypothetical protein
MIGSALLDIVNGKLADPFGVFVPPCTRRVIPFVLDIVTVEVQFTVPVHVSSTISPSLAAEIAAFTALAEQSDGPTVWVSPHATTEATIRNVMDKSITRTICHLLFLLLYNHKMQLSTVKLK